MRGDRQRKSSFSRMDGLVRISPQPLIDLQQSIKEQMAEEPAPRANAGDAMNAPARSK
jgi:hypothetical protein